jgi:hypothetical protein
MARILLVHGGDAQDGARLSDEAEVFPAMGHDMMLDHGWHKVADRVHECASQAVLLAHPAPERHSPDA